MTLSFRLDLYRRKGLTEKTDIWALGVLLYKLCYYTTPFEQDGSLAILNCRYQIPPNPQYSLQMQGAIKSILLSDPAQRPNIFQIVSKVCGLRGRPCPIENIYGPPVPEKELPTLPNVAQDHEKPVTASFVLENPESTGPAFEENRPAMRRGRVGRQASQNSSAVFTNAPTNPSPATTTSHHDVFNAQDPVHSHVPQAQPLIESLPPVSSNDPFAVVAQRVSPISAPFGDLFDKVNEPAANLNYSIAPGENLLNVSQGALDAQGFVPLTSQLTQDTKDPFASIRPITSEKPSDSMSLNQNRAFPAFDHPKQMNHSALDGNLLGESFTTVPFPSSASVTSSVIPQMFSAGPVNMNAFEKQADMGNMGNPVDLLGESFTASRETQNTSQYVASTQVQSPDFFASFHPLDDGTTFQPASTATTGTMGIHSSAQSSKPSSASHNLFDILDQSTSGNSLTERTKPTQPSELFQDLLSDRPPFAPRTSISALSTSYTGTPAQPVALTSYRPLSAVNTGSSLSYPHSMSLPYNANRTPPSISLNNSMSRSMDRQGSITSCPPMDPTLAVLNRIPQQKAFIPSPTYYSKGAVMSVPHQNPTYFAQPVISQTSPHGSYDPSAILQKLSNGGSQVNQRPFSGPANEGASKKDLINWDA